MYCYKSYMNMVILALFFKITYTVELSNFRIQFFSLFGGEILPFHLKAL
jgi:hypothetical protein